MRLGLVRSTGLTLDQLLDKPSSELRMIVRAAGTVVKMEDAERERIRAKTASGQVDDTLKGFDLSGLEELG